MFADLHNFTALAESMDFEAVSDLLKTIWARLDRVIEDHSGFIDKHMGDGVMAVWGAPYAHEDDAERAVAAGLELHRVLRTTLQRLSHIAVDDLQLRVGIHTGLVMATYLGLHNEYTMMGDTVNIAQRLQEMAYPGTVVISASTYRLVRGVYRVQRLETVTLRGRKEPIGAYRVLERLPQPTVVRYRGGTGMEVNLVGRDAELDRLRKAFQHMLQSRQPFGVVVIGESGLGKSRLLMEYTAELETLVSNLNLFSARGLPEATKVPFFLWKTLWYNRFNLSDNETPEAARTRFLRGVHELWGKQLGPVPAIQAAHVIGDLIGLKWPGSPYVHPNDTPDERMKQATEMTRVLLQRVAAQGPVVLLLDDLHWADSGSMDMLQALLQPTESPLPLLVLAGARPELQQRTSTLYQHMTAIFLEPLPRRAELVREAFPALKRLPDSVLQALIDRADGVPYFMEEIAKSLLQNGLVNGRDADEAALLAHIRHKIPASLNALLQARLDALPNSARGVALLASVVGRVFWSGAVVAAAQQSIQMATGILQITNERTTQEVQLALQELTRAEMAFPRVGSVLKGEQEYIFKHALLQEVAYSMLPIKYRKMYHLAVARWLAQRVGPDLKPVVAHHLEQAGLYLEAAQQYAIAAEHARHQGVDEEARWLARRAERLRRQAVGG